MAARSRGLWTGSGRPCFAATVISRASLENSLERSLSCRPLRNMMFLYCEWPAMRTPSHPRQLAGAKGTIKADSLHGRMLHEPSPDAHRFDARGQSFRIDLDKDGA